MGTAAIIGGPPADSAVDKGRDDLAEESSGRADLITGGIDLFQDSPIIGQGAGSFATSYRLEIERVKKPVSHTEPITVAAEQGILGLIPYAAVLFLSAVVLLRPWPASSAARAGVAAAFVALLVHSLGYAGFAIDPATWALIALGLALRE
jgi:O-antigen ligase